MTPEVTIELRDNRRSKFQEEDGKIPPELLQKFDAESQQIQKERGFRKRRPYVGQVHLSDLG